MASKGDVELNSEGYFIKGEVREVTLPSFGEARRDVGGATEANILDQERVTLLTPIYGMGVNRIQAGDHENPLYTRRWYDSTVETRFRDGIRLPILAEDSVETGLEVIRASIDYTRSGLSQHWAIWEDDTSTDLVARTFDGSDVTWDAGADILADATIKVGLDIIAYKTEIVALFASGSDHLAYNANSGGGSWANASTTPITTGHLIDAVSAHEDIDAGLLAEIGGELVAVIWQEDAGNIILFSCTDTNTWTRETIDIPSGNGPQGVAVMPGVGGADKLFVGTKEGLYAVDTSQSTWTWALIYAMAPHTDNCRRMTVNNGVLYFGTGVDDNSVPDIVRVSVVADSYDIKTSWGMGRDDGVADATWLGPIRWWAPAGREVFFSQGGGAASRNARIFALREEVVNGELVPSIHFMHRNSTANQKTEWIALSGRDDGNQRLHFAIRTGSGTSDTQSLKYPCAAPGSGLTITRATTGVIYIPFYDYGMPTTDGAVMRLEFDATSLGAATTGNYVAVTYGVNDAARITSFDNLETGVTEMDFGSGAGVQMKNVGLGFSFQQDDGDTTESPVIHSITIISTKHVPIRRGWTFTIDLDRTSDENSIPVEKVLTNIETARDLKTLPAFSYGPMSTVAYVRVLPWDWKVKRHDGSMQGAAVASDALIQRGGEIGVTLAEFRG